MTAGTRYRMVHVQNGTEHVDSVVIGESEVREHLEALYEIHEATGWRVEVAREHSVKFPTLLCVRGQSMRRIFVRKSSPLQDSVAAQVGSPLPPAPLLGGDAEPPQDRLEIT